ncbi:MAG: hypothetical protein V7L22_19820 [Nostoc sp.]
MTKHSAIAYPFSYTINCVNLSHYPQSDVLHDEVRSRSPPQAS